MKAIKPDFREEKKLWRRGFMAVVGLDEAGRGPLAGPVVAAAFVLTPKAAAKLKIKSAKLKIKENIKDSKKLTARQRETWYAFLTQYPDIKWGVGIVSEKIIDKINILEATKLAMKRAMAKLNFKPDYLLLDGNFLLSDLAISQRAVVKGDEKIWSCAAASVIAKVTRDRLMMKCHRRYSVYGFDQHKGYGTVAHLAAIKKHGASPIHRLSFRPLKGAIM
jgi:ribonuclease HII